MTCFGNLTWRGGRIVVVILALSILATACSQTNAPSSSASTNQATLNGGTSAGSASMEVVHASYLDLASNIADLRARVDQWQKGDEASLNIAKEKLDRIEVVLTATSWPANMSRATTTVNAAVAPMKRALNDKDQTQAGTLAKTFGDASHDVTHAFYGDWLPRLKGQHFSIMAPHAIYLDLNANITDLKTRIAAWEKGDEASINVAKEKVDRILALVQHALSTEVLIKPLNAIGASLPPISVALERKDVTAATGALKPLSDAAHDLTHDYYAWLKVTAGSNDPACIQAAYADLSTNITDLKARVTAWEQGDVSSLNIAQEKLDRIQIVLTHANWPQSMAGAIQKVGSVVPEITRAFSQQNPAMSQQAITPISDATHDLTHAFYGDFLPHRHSAAGQIVLHSDMPSGYSTMPTVTTQKTGQSDMQMDGSSDMPMGHSMNPAATTQTMDGSSDMQMGQSTASTTGEPSGPHSHSANTVAVPNSDKGLILGGFGAVNGLVIALAAIFKIRSPKKKKAENISSTGGLVK